MNKLEQKIKTQSFTFEDFLDQLQQLKDMGPLDQLMDMMPGMAGNKKLKDFSVDETELVKVEAIIQSMTKEERVKPEIINSSRKKRIARGSGTRVQDVNKLLTRKALNNYQRFLALKFAFKAFKSRYDVKFFVTGLISLLSPWLMLKLYSLQKKLTG